MTIVAPKIPEGAFNDIIEVLDKQPWLSSHSDALTELWNLCETVPQRSLIKSLIMRVFLLDSSREQTALDGVSEAIAAWGLNYANTLIVAPANKEESDGSHVVLQKLKNKIHPIEDWHSKFVSNIPVASEKVKDGFNVVFVDDFIGTGGKLKKKADWMRRLARNNGINDLNFYFAAFSGMRFGVENLRGTTGCEVFATHMLEKGISDFYPSEEVEVNLELMKAVESKLSESYKRKNIADYSLGYGSSEALYCACNDNCPNNVFPVLWWPLRKDGSTFATIFRRAG